MFMENCRIKSPLDCGGQQTESINKGKKGVEKVLVNFSPQLDKPTNQEGPCLLEQLLTASDRKPSRSDPLRECRTCRREVIVTTVDTSGKLLFY